MKKLTVHWENGDIEVFSLEEEEFARLIKFLNNTAFYNATSGIKSLGIFINWAKVRKVIV